MNQIHISGGSRVHIGDIHVRPAIPQSTEPEDMDVNKRPKPEDNNITVIGRYTHMTLEVTESGKPQARGQQHYCVR